MRRTLALFVAALLLLPAMAGDKKGGGKLPEGYAWEPNFDMAKLKAAEQGKLLFLDFFTEW